jgi:hypothetical protein
MITVKQTNKERLKYANFKERRERERERERDKELPYNRRESDYFIGFKQSPVTHARNKTCATAVLWSGHA